MAEAEFESPTCVDAILDKTDKTAAPRETFRVSTVAMVKMPAMSEPTRARKVWAKVLIALSARSSKNFLLYIKCLRCQIQRAYLL